MREENENYVACSLRASDRHAVSSSLPAAFWGHTIPDHSRAQIYRQCTQLDKWQVQNGEGMFFSPPSFGCSESI